VLERGATVSILEYSWLCWKLGGFDFDWQRSICERTRSSNNVSCKFAYEL